MKSRKQKKDSSKQGVRSCDTVKDIRIDEESLCSLSDIGTASLPVGGLGVVVLLNDMPLVLDLDIPCWVGQGPDCGGDGVVGAGSGVGSDALAVGLEPRRVLGCGRGDVEAVGTAAGGAFEGEVGCSPGGGLTVGESVGQAQGGEDHGEERSELHGGGDGLLSREYGIIDTGGGVGNVQFES